ncbi:MAG: translation initiation factor IF-2 [Cyanobacteria bacterium]|nr:translation initiation factor IF-2 [Cyanobacteriota bacterium]
MAVSKVRIYELSKELGLSNKDVMALLEKEFGIELKSHSSSVDKDVADKLAALCQNAPKNQKSEKPKATVKPSSSIESAIPVDAMPQVKTNPAMEVSRSDRPPVGAVVEPKSVTSSPEQKKFVAPSTATTKTSTPADASKPQVKAEAKPSSETKSAPVASPPPVEMIQTVVRREELNQPTRPSSQNYQQQNRPGQGQGQYGQQRQQQQSYQPTQKPYQAPGNQSPGTHTNVASANAPAKPRDSYSKQPTSTTEYQAPPRPQGQHPQRPGGGHPQSAKPGSKPFGQPDRRPVNASSGSKRAEKPMGATQTVVEAAPEVDDTPKIVKIHEPLTVSELALRLNLRETEIIKHLFMKGAMVTVNQTLDANYAKSVAKEFGFELDETPHPSLVKGDATAPAIVKKVTMDETKYKHLQHRSPVISIMGHVDHGKTSLLDAIRETRHKIVDSEAGGITQSIGAYTVEKNGQNIVFLDTPGHEAFTSMRMRGARATDIAILVVAADDGVMPQTIEAINHAKAANIPIIVAVNKIDKAGADPEKVLVQLSEHGLVSEKWGGDVVTVEVSAIQKLGLDDLLEMILLVSELLELKADATVAAEGVIIEAQLDKRKGPTATALVQNGTLKVGDNVLIGSVGGRVRALFDDMGERIIKAGPSSPVEILGLNDVPKAGDHFQVIRDEKKFKQLLSEGKLQERDQRLGSRSLSTGFATTARQEGSETPEQMEFNVIIKADTQGSAEAVNGALSRLSTDEIKVKVIHTGTGDISEADVMLASASNTIIIGFNVKDDGKASIVAEQSGVKIYKYDVIYHINEEMEKLMLGKLSPDTQEVEAGQVEVRQLFSVGKNMVIAGCYVLKGKAIRGAKAKVMRNGKEIFAGVLDNLKRFKDDAREVATGYECGISFSKFNDLQVGDLILISKIEETERTSL